MMDFAELEIVLWSQELIITAGGENIPPVLIEEQVLKNVPSLSNAMLIGDQKKFLAMLVTFKVYTLNLVRHDSGAMTSSDERCVI